MGVRPPQQGDDGEPATVAFGIAALDERLERTSVSFPATDEELHEVLGGTSVPFDANGNEVSLSEALAKVDQQEFDNRQQLMNELHPVFEAKRKRTNNSVVSRLRSLLPF